MSQSDSPIFWKRKYKSNDCFMKRTNRVNKKKKIAGECQQWSKQLKKD